MKRKINLIIFYLLLFISILIIFSVFWVEKTFGLINIDSLLFHLLNPLKGTGMDMIYSFIFDPILKTIILFVICFVIFNHKYTYRLYINLNIFNYKINDIDVFSIIRKISSLIGIVLLFLSILFFCYRFDVFEYIKNLNTESDFIENNYVDPSTTKINFKNKRNLIYIMLESMEYTYADKKNGGAYEENYIPYLTNYAKEEISFRNSYNGGFVNSRATGWTIAAMVAQSAGIGFLVPGSGNDYGEYSKFLPGAYSLGDILEKEGYNQVLLLGSDSSFAGRKEYYEQHGNYIIKDYNYAKENDWIDDDYYVWWGYEDSKLYEFAKKELIDLSKKSEPFNLTLLTTNTHHIGGYLEETCENKYDEKLLNVVACADKQIYEFVEWIKEQDFYENTTIVITGDHLSMEPTFFDSIDDDYERSNYNVFINSVNNPKNINNRVFNSLDIYPTILGSMGVNIDGNRLALGTNMFSNTKTLYEQYGRSIVDTEFSKYSLYFRNHIVNGIN